MLLFLCYVNVTWALFPFFKNQSLQFLYNSLKLSLKLESIRTHRSLVLLLCKLCGSNASVSIETRNNILLSQLPLFFFSPPLPPFPSFPSPPSLPFPSSKQCAIQHLWISWRQSNMISPYKSSTCSIVPEGVVLLKPKFPPVAFENAVLFCLAKGDRDSTFSSKNSNLHSVHNPCLWITVFVDLWVSYCNVGIQLWSDERHRKHTGVWWKWEWRAYQTLQRFVQLKSW